MGKFHLNSKWFYNYLAWLFLMSFGSAGYSQTLKPITIAAAANLNGTLEQIVTQYQLQSKQDIKIVYGSSGNFYQQIIQGGPFDIFLSANADFPDRLEKEGLAREGSKVYAKGRLVLWVSPKVKVNLDSSLNDFKAALADGRIRQFAIANPKLAPYGLAAEQSLNQYGIWNSLQNRIILGADVGQTALYLSSGAAVAGMIPYSLVGRSTELKAGKIVVIPENYHETITQKMLLLKKASLDAKGFYDFITSEAAKKIWRENGYD
jgi:molybdate transport system substrate-binding protein